MKFFIRILLSLLLLFCLFYSADSQNQSKLKTEDYQVLTNDGGWCWFSDPRAIFHKGIHEQLYTAWVTHAGDIMISAYNTKDKSITKKVLHAKFQADDHDVPAILFRPDGRLLVFYMQHGGKYYSIISKNPEDINEWEPAQRLPFGDNACYAHPIMLSKEHNRIYLFWRGSDWRPTFAYSDDLGKSWTEPKAYVERLGALASNRPYVKVISDNKERIDIIFTDGHPRDEAKNSVYHMYYQQGSFHQTDGTPICTLAELPVKHALVHKVYDGTITGVRAWIWEIALDKNNRPIIVYAQLPAENDHRYHYAQWNGKSWTDIEICKAGGWMPLTPKGTTEREPHYSGGIAIDHGNPKIVYLSRPVNGVFEIEKWTLEQHGSWKAEAITSNSKLNNIRPFVVRDWQGKGPHILWLTGIYNHYTDFYTSIIMDMPKK